MALSMELRAQIDRVRMMARCCNERELCSGCPFENEPECHPLATAMELIDTLEEAAETEWRDTNIELPADCDELVLCRVNGRHGSVEFRDARCLGTYHDGEGWVLEAWPDWENPGVTLWTELP